MNCTLWRNQFSITQYLFVLGFPSHSRIFHTYWDVFISGEELQIFTYAQHSRSLSVRIFLACHIYCAMGHLFIMVISENPWHSHQLPSIWQWSCLYLFFTTKVCCGLDSNIQPSACVINLYIATSIQRTLASLSIFSSQLYMYICELYTLFIHVYS